MGGVGSRPIWYDRSAGLSECHDYADDGSRARESVECPGSGVQVRARRPRAPALATAGAGRITARAGHGGGSGRVTPGAATAARAVGLRLERVVGGAVRAAVAENHRGDV